MIFWISNLYNYKSLKNNETISPAATEWQTQFIRALKKHSKHKVFIINYNYSKFWPFGKIYLKKNLFSLKDVKSYSFNYINLPFLKDINIKREIRKKINEFKQFEKKIIFTYNFDKVAISTAKELKVNNHIKWISIVADFDRKDQKIIEQKVEKADLVVYLSNYAFKQSNIKSKILIQGGIDKIEKKKF